jgi:Sugar (and other) transporter
MLMQQLCRVSATVYHSTVNLIDSGHSTNTTLLASMGTGTLNWIFTLPAFFTIEIWGIHNLLSLASLAIFLFGTGVSFWFREKLKRTAMVATSMYLFEVFYSPGGGPVLFTHSAECFPLHVRDAGMS